MINAEYLQKITQGDVMYDELDMLLSRQASENCFFRGIPHMIPEISEYEEPVEVMEDIIFQEERDFPLDRW